MTTKTKEKPAAPVDTGSALVFQAGNQAVDMIMGPLHDALKAEAQLYANSTLVPKDFQLNPANCYIVMQMAHRINFDKFMMLQNMYVVHGKPGMSGQLVIALINSSDLFAGQLNFRFEGEGRTRSCTAYATRAITGEVCEVTVDMDIAHAEGWVDKSGSKWQSMPDQMLRYRSASWFGRAYAPERLMGLQSADELEDVGPDSPHVGWRKAKVVNDVPAEATEAPVTEAEGDPQPPAEAEVEPVAPEAEKEADAPVAPDKAPKQTQNEPVDVEPEPEPEVEPVPEPEPDPEPEVEPEPDPEPEPEVEQPAPEEKKATRKTEHARCMAEVAAIEDFDELVQWSEDNAKVIGWIGEASAKIAQEINDAATDKMQRLST
jgi:hypothetical protein